MDNLKLDINERELITYLKTIRSDILNKISEQELSDLLALVEEFSEPVDFEVKLDLYYDEGYKDGEFQGYNAGKEEAAWEHEAEIDQAYEKGFRDGLDEAAKELEA